MHSPVYYPTPAHTAHLRVLAPYLPYGIEVEHAALGRGVLVGLPACHVNDLSPLASVRFDGLPSFPDYYELGSVKPVLYAAEDAAAVVAALPSIQRTGGHFGLTIHEAEQLNHLARIVDTARALGIALNLPEGSYVRKELAHV
jgi:hypothetical protein